LESVDADLVVVGTGVAGLAAALGARGLRVQLLTKSALASGASPWAQGGVAAAVGAGDSPELHAADTVAAGAGLVDPEVAEIVARQGALAIRRLIEIGAELDRGERGEIALGREAAHSRRRIVHARGDATGAELVRALGTRVAGEARIEIAERARALELALAGGRAAGIVARHGDGRLVLHRAPRVVLATGGLGQLYRYTTNPAEATGDGLYLAARAGARLVDVEFVQFHPTALALAADPLPLLTEALRGEGAVVVDARGRRFLAGEHPDAELAPRDVVARGIWKRLAAGERVFLDARAALGERFPRRFPRVFAACRAAGIDPRSEPMPVVPAAHYFMGGIDVDPWGRTSVPGLWACGEVASTGVHGANRLASNSLLEALVFGARVAESALGGEAAPGSANARGGESAAGEALARAERDLAPAPAAPELRRELRALAWERLGLVRDGAGLAAARARLADFWRALPSGAGELRHLVAAAQLVAAAAERRTESRGAHYRSDFPDTAPAWRLRQTVTVAFGRDGAAPGFEDRAVDEAAA
jgi:L-aspartate oxidase